MRRPQLYTRQLTVSCCKISMFLADICTATWWHCIAIWPLVRMHGMPLYLLGSHFFRTPSSKMTERHSSKLCHMFADEPALNTIVQNLKLPFLKTWGPKTAYFGSEHVSGMWAANQKRSALKCFSATPASLSVPAPQPPAPRSSPLHRFSATPAPIHLIFGSFRSIGVAMILSEGALFFLEKVDDILVVALKTHVKTT